MVVAVMVMPAERTAHQFGGILGSHGQPQSSPVVVQTAPRALAVARLVLAAQARNTRARREAGAAAPVRV
jgi:hypothetical protein